MTRPPQMRWYLSFKFLTPLAHLGIQYSNGPVGLFLLSTIPLGPSLTKCLVDMSLYAQCGFPAMFAPFPRTKPCAI